MYKFIHQLSLFLSRQQPILHQINTLPQTTTLFMLSPCCHQHQLPKTHSSPPSKPAWTRRPRCLNATSSPVSTRPPSPADSNTAEEQERTQRKQKGQRLTILNTVLPSATPASPVRGRLYAPSSASLATAFYSSHARRLGASKRSRGREGFARERLTGRPLAFLSIDAAAVCAWGGGYACVLSGVVSGWVWWWVGGGRWSGRGGKGHII